MNTCSIQFFNWDLISAILEFLYHDIHVSCVGFLVMDNNWKKWAFVLGCEKYLHGNKLRVEKN